MDYNSRLEISFYKTIAVINEEHHIYLVQHLESKKIYIKKVLSFYNKDLYAQLMATPPEGIPRIYCMHEEDNLLTVIEEYITGSTIADLLEKNGAFSPKEVTEYTTQLLEILERLHSFNPPIIHRDIKPSNIIITPENRLVLLDMNAARRNIPKEEDTVLMGTTGYAAPEQFGFGSSTMQTDIYAVGMLMNTMLWGEFTKTPFENSTLTPIIKQCTALNPNDRVQSVNQLMRLLKATKPKRKSETPFYILPGFRSKTPWHMLVAIPTYIFVFWICLGPEMSPNSTYNIILKIASLIIVMLIILCSTNYMNLQRLMPLCSSRNLFVRILGVLLLDFAVFITVIILLAIFVPSSIQK